jgi:tripartite-type tricarboxylate transporter receptor subunit TctC
MPDVPTVAELGFPGFEAILWMGIFAPQGVPNDILDKFSNALTACLKDPEIAKQLQNQGLQISNLNRIGMDKFLRSEINKWSQVIKTSGIVAE